MSSAAAHPSGLKINHTVELNATVIPFSEMSIYSPPQERAGIFDALLKPTSTWTFPAQSATSTISPALSSSQFLPTVISKATKLSLITPTFADIAAALSEGGVSGLSASHPLVVSIARLSFSICEHALVTTTSVVDPRVVASLLVAISYCPDDVAPSLVRAGANDAIVMTSVSHLRTTSSSSSSSTATAIPGSVLSPSSSSAASSLFKDEQRSLFIAKEVPEAIKAIDEVFKNQKQQQVNVLSVTATSDLVFNLFSSRRHIGCVSKQSLVIGGLIGGGGGEEEREKSSNNGTLKSDVLIESSNSSIIIEDCQDTAIFVTVSVTMLCLRRLKRCTIVCVPSSIAFNVEDCSHCTVSGCARSVTIKNCTEVKLFTLMSQFASLREGQTSSEERVMSIPVFGDSREIVIGPYNVCAPGIISSTPLALWASTGTAADTDKHTYDTSSASPTRPMLRHEYYVRYLPTAGASDSAPLNADVKDGHGSSTASRSSESKTSESLPVERISPERFFANENSSSTGATAQEEESERLQIESDLASLDVPTAQRAELLLQSSFVTWLLEDNKASGLKNSLR